MSEDHRPDPDALLREVERDDVKKGRLKIFLGYAPGVGKTYAMLQDAHVYRKRGSDIVAGYVETHARAETDALLAGLETIPFKSCDYRGVALKEMDIDAILVRRPAVVLVDELAHTNVEGSRHPKRYQDIEELLDNGIDVHTTVNIQHFESMNDAVAKITGTRVQETLPDTFFDRADEVQVIDVPWEELHQRLKEGKVYIPRQALRAMDNFFQRGNLFALRELMLTFAARKMDGELINYMRAKAIPGPWPASEKLIVCVGPSPYAKQLIRKAYTIAKDTRAQWYAVYVQPAGFLDPTGRDKAYLTDALNLGEELGARIITLSGSDIAEEILHFARENNITRIVIGKPLRSMLAEFVKKSPASKLLYAHGEFELHMIAPTGEAKETPEAAPARPPLFNISHFAAATLMLIAVTGFNFFLQRFIDPFSLVLLYLIPIIASALLFGISSSIFASILSLLIFDFFFTQPRFTLAMSDPREMIHALVFLLTGIIVGQLVKVVKRQSQALQLRLERVTLIEEMSKDFLALPPLEQLVEGLAALSSETLSTMTFLRTTILSEISNLTVKYVQRIVQVPCVILFKEKHGELMTWATNDSKEKIGTNDIAVANWCVSHGAVAGAGTETLPSAPYFFFPIKSPEETIGVIAVRQNYKDLLPEQRQMLGTIANLTSLTAARWVKI